MTNTHHWEQMHQEGNRPWDLMGVTPMLKYFIETEMIKFNFSNMKRILIPGCGQKNDSEYLANRFPNAEVIAIDISPTAIENCKRENKIENLKFIEVDFFKLNLGSFDLVFDQTFFCAIDPKIRTNWGQKMKEIIGLNGYLLTVIYPLPREASQDIDLIKGPPFEVNFSAYENFLQQEFQCVARWGGEILPISNEKRRGREELALWQRKM